MIAKADSFQLEISPARQRMAAAIRGAMPRPVRTRRDFHEQEIIVPGGPHADEPFRVSTQPVVGPLLEAMDDDAWQTIVITAPSQSGKTLAAFVGEIAYHVAELREKMVVALPDLNMAADKWSLDIEPVFKSSPSLRGLLPAGGKGSKGGVVDNLVQFAHGPVLKFMSLGGRDQRRAGFTTRVVAVTELAGFNASAQTSREAGPLKQISARQRAYSRKSRRTYLEGTVTVEEEMPASLEAGSAVARLVSPCPHCEEWIQPDREHLVGWDQATDEDAAGELARFACPLCGRLIDDAQRKTALAAVRMMFSVGDDLSEQPPPTGRLYFRWSGWHNLLTPIGDMGVEEWLIRQHPEGTDERDDADREASQFTWARAWRAPGDDSARLTAHVVRRRQTSDGFSRSQVPDDTRWLTLGVDIGKHNGHFVLEAWRPGGRILVVDYDVFTVPTAGGPGDPGLDVHAAIMAALWNLHDRFAAGVGKKSGGVKQLDRAGVDAGWQGEAVYQWMREAAGAGGHRADSVWMPVVGLGTGQHEQRHYHQPKQRTKSVRVIGEQYFISRHKTERCYVVELDADHWKSWLHDRLTTPQGQRGSLELFQGTEHTHRDFARHMTAERAQLEVVAGVGLRRVWRNLNRRPNHFFDSANYGAVMGHLSGFRVVEAEKTAPRRPRRWWSR